MTKKWFTAKELQGLASLPKSANSVSRKATAENWQKRQRQGVKGIAYEYHLSSLPEDVRAILSSPESDDVNYGESRKAAPIIDNRLISALGFLTYEEQQRAIEVVRVSGILGLMPTIVSRETAMEALGISPQILHTALTLQALPSETVREILSRYENTEHVGPVAPSEEPHKKAV